MSDRGKGGEKDGMTASEWDAISVAADAARHRTISNSVARRL